MQRLIEQLRDELERFVGQRDDLILCVRASDEEASVVLKLLRDLEQTQGSDLFLLFGGEFEDATSFAQSIVEGVDEQRVATSAALVDASRAPLPALPPALLEAATPASERLRGVARYTRSLLPDGGGHRVVLAMFPDRVHDRAGWYSLATELAPWNGVEPWMAHTRMVLRDPAPGDGPPPDLSRAPRTRFARADFSATAIERAVRADISDPSLPLESRMQALVTEASLDHANDRPDAAIEKYRRALGHYQHTNNLTMQAMVMHGLGDVSRRAGRVDVALEWFECATVPAASCGAPVVLAIVTRSLGQLALERRRYADAEGYFDALDTLAGRLLDPENKAYALEWKGVAQHAQRRAQEAIATWEAGRALCRNVGMPAPQRNLLAHLHGAYREAGMAHHARAAAREAADLPWEERAHG